MLLKLTIENAFSIKKLELDFTKARYAYRSDMIYNDTIVNPIVLYGYNGSGKSSLFKAMAFLASFFLEGDNYPLEINYLLEQQAVKEKQSNYLFSSFKLTFKIANLVYNYNLLYNHEFIKEELDENNKHLLVRINDIYTTYLYHEEMNKVKNPNKSVLLELSSIMPLVYDFLSNISVVLDNRINTVAKVLANHNLYDLFLEHQKDIVDILKDFPLIPSFEIVKKNFKYELKFENNYLPVTYLSKGSFNICLILSLLLTSPSNSLLFIDDLDSNLHPFILERIIKLANEKEIQLIFSSHNTHIMQLLRPDQIYFASFSNLASSYKRLSDLKENIREINNIEKMYLSYVFLKEE